MHSHVSTNYIVLQTVHVVIIRSFGVVGKDLTALWYEFTMVLSLLIASI